MNPISRVAIIGECMVELKKVGGSITQGFGGDTLNTAVYLSRLTHQQGITTSYLTGLGQDPFSADMLSAWQTEGLDTSMVYPSSDKLPGIYAIQTRDDGERSFYYWRNDSAAKYWLREQDPQHLLRDLCQHQMVYLSGISLAILPDDGRRTLFELLTAYRQQGGMIAFDNNYRPALWSSADHARACYAEMLALTDIAFLTFDDEVMLYGDEQEDQAIARTQAFGVKEIVVKRGGEDCLVISGQLAIAVTPPPVANIIDTTAAGDSFSAGYLAKRLTGGSEQDAALAGHIVAGRVIQHRGAIIPKDAMPEI